MIRFQSVPEAETIKNWMNDREIGVEPVSFSRV